MSIKTRELLDEMAKAIIMLLLLGIFRSYDHFLDAFHFEQSFYSNPFFRYVWNVIFMILFIYLIVYWFVSFQSTVQHKKMKRNLSVIALLLLFWFLVRCVKYEMAEGVVQRILWYLYYIPLLFAPLMGLLTALYIGHEESWNIPKNYHLIAIPSIVLFLCVITNELHHKIFIFDPMVFDVYGTYSYGNLYYLLAFWIIFLTVYMLILVYRKCRIMGSKQMIWIPSVIMVIPLIWSLMKLFYNIEILEISIIYIWSYLALWQSLIYTGLIPSNIEHEVLFDAATLSAQIVDKNNEIVYSSQNAQTISKYLIEKSKTQETHLDERTLIKTAPIHGGSILWLEDISSMNIMISKLRNLQVQLEDNNELLEAEIELKEKQERIQVQNQVYDQIVNELSITIANLDKLLKAEEPDLVRICFVGAYIKRMSNLIILEQNNDSISARELDYCFKESMDVLQTNHIVCSWSNRIDGDIDISVLKRAYTFFVMIVDYVYEYVSSVMITFSCKEKYILKLTMEGCFKSSLENHISAKIEQEEDTTYITYEIERENKV